MTIATVTQCPTCSGAIFSTQNGHLCDPKEIELTANMKRSSDEQEAREGVLIHAFNAMLEWVNLKCDHGRLRLPIKFTMAMEDLDRSVDRLETLKRESRNSQEGSPK